MRLHWDIDYSNHNPIHELYIVDTLIATLEQDHEDKNCYSITSSIMGLSDSLFNCKSIQMARKVVEKMYRDYTYS